MSLLPTSSPGGGDFWDMISTNAIPALFTSIAVKDPGTSGALESMLPYYAQVAQNAAQQRDAYLAAVGRADAAAQAMPTPGQAAGKAGTDTQMQLATQRGQMQKDLAARGALPGSGADVAAYGESGALGSAAIVNNMNAAGDRAATSRAGALDKVAGLYGNVPGGNEMMGAAAGSMNVVNGMNSDYNNRIRNAMAAFKMPGVNPLAGRTDSQSIINYHYGNRTNQDQAPLVNAMGLPLGGDEGE